VGNAKDQSKGLNDLKNRSEKCEGSGQGGDQRLFEKKSFFENQKHQPNIVEITHLCIMHGVHTSQLVSQTTISLFVILQVTINSLNIISTLSTRDINTLTLRSV